MKWDRKQTGFTIVELLVVIVVIAILAAITIVSYNGITNRAKESAAAGYLHSFSQKYQTQVITNGGNLTVAQFGVLQSTITPGSGINSSLFSSNDGTQVFAFCIDTHSSTGIASYFVNSSDRQSPTKGVCAGTDAGEYTLQ